LCATASLQRLSLGALLAVAAYDGICTSRLNAASAALHAEARRLRAELRQLEGGTQ
jgi:hypothetical protein